MMSRKPKNGVRKLSPQEQARLNALAEKIDREEKDEIVALGRKYKAEALERLRAAMDSLESIGAMLRKEREGKGYSLSDVARETGMHKPAVSKLETDPGSNPTIATLARYAMAIGKRLRIELVDDEPEPARK